MLSDAQKFILLVYCSQHIALLLTVSTRLLNWRVGKYVQTKANCGLSRTSSAKTLK